MKNLPCPHTECTALRSVINKLNSLFSFFFFFSFLLTTFFGLWNVSFLKCQAKDLQKGSFSPVPCARHPFSQLYNLTRYTTRSHNLGFTTKLCLSMESMIVRLHSWAEITAGGDARGGKDQKQRFRRSRRHACFSPGRARAVSLLTPTAARLPRPCPTGSRPDSDPPSQGTLDVERVPPARGVTALCCPAAERGEHCLPSRLFPHPPRPPPPAPYRAPPGELARHDANHGDPQRRRDEVQLQHLSAALREGEDGGDPLHHHGVAEAL